MCFIIITVFRNRTSLSCQTVELSGCAFGSSQNPKSTEKFPLKRCFSAQSFTMARALPALTDQDSTATGIPSWTSVQSSSGRPRGHHFITLAQRTGSATGKESDQGCTCGRTTTPKLLSPKPPATDSNQPPRQSTISESSRHVEDEERAEREENRRRGEAVEVEDRRRRQDAARWENLQRMQ